MKIEAFAGVFQFAGTDRKFALVDGELRIGPLSISEASGVLSSIEDREGVQPAEVAKPAQHPNHVEEQRARREVDPPKAKRAKAAEPPKAEPAPEPPKAEPVAGPTAAVDDGIPFGNPEPAPVAPDAAGGNGGAATAKPAADALAGAKRLVDVIIALQEQGFTETETIIAECERLRTSIPLLDRIPDMRERVERALSTLGQ